MLGYDLTATQIAQSKQPVAPPSEGELLALTVALLTNEHRSLADLPLDGVALTDRNARRVAELIEERTPSLAREFGPPPQLRRRLKQLIGLRVTREPRIG